MITHTSFLTRKGLTLLETALVLLIVGSVLSVLWILVDNTQSNARIEANVEQIYLLKQRLRDYHTQKSSVAAGDITNAMKALGTVFPQDMVLSATPTLSGWKTGNATVTVSGSDPLGNTACGTTCYAVRIDISNLPRAGCARLAPRVATGSLADGASALLINNASKPLTTSFNTADTDCGSASPATLSIVYTIRRAG